MGLGGRSRGGECELAVGGRVEGEVGEFGGGVEGGVCEFGRGVEGGVELGIVLDKIMDSGESTSICGDDEGEDWVELFGIRGHWRAFVWGMGQDLSGTKSDKRWWGMGKN